ncbi:MAG: phosphatidylserine decarboxylase [Candidatus Schekmanbacteria bacterium]|nr:phosphatidylserine decarboxylase [Candidatus Schekmanbacteria bacterium]
MPFPEPVQYVDRQTGTIETERVLGRGFLSRLYHTAPGRLTLRVLLARRASSVPYGWLNSLPATAWQLRRFAKALGIDTREAEKPLTAYRSINELFARRLRPGARPFDADPAILASPAEGRVLAYDSLAGDTVVPAKGANWSLGDLLGGTTDARRWHGGAALVVRLAPIDYHRFHFPDDGVAARSYRVLGALHSVSPIALASGLPIFPRNQRDVCLFASRGFGTIAIVEIGALGVGTIRQTYVPGSSVSRGDEKGYFLLGGSTVVLLLQPGVARLDGDLVASTSRGLETFVRCGTHVASRA